MTPTVNLPYTFPSPLRTERLTLRTMVAGDVDDIYAYQSREDVCRYLTFGPRGPGPGRREGRQALRRR